MAKAAIAGEPSPEALMTLLAQQFKEGMRLLAGSVSIITTAHQDRRFGMTATAVCSMSLEPPTLLVCINQRAATHDAVRESGCFCVNILREDEWPLSRVFSGVQAGEARFNVCRWERRHTGAPMLLNALVSLDCSVVNSVSHGTHTVFLGEVRDIALGNKATPLLYAEGRYAKIGALAAGELLPEGLDYWEWK